MNATFYPCRICGARVNWIVESTGGRYRHEAGAPRHRRHTPQPDHRFQVVKTGGIMRILPIPYEGDGKGVITLDAYLAQVLRESGERK